MLSDQQQTDGLQLFLFCFVLLYFISDVRTPAIRLLYKSCAGLHELAEKFYIIAGIRTCTAVKQNTSCFTVVIVRAVATDCIVSV